MEQQPLDKRTITALLAGLAVLLVIVSTIAAIRSSSEDRLGDASDLQAVDSDLNAMCDGQPLYEQIKRALFRQASAVRANDSERYADISRSASVRMENPAGESRDAASGMVNCAGSLSLDLPPGITTAAGRRLLMMDIYYVVDPAGGGSGRVVQLRGANTLVDQLASLNLSAPVPAPVVIAPQAPAPDDLAPLPDADLGGKEDGSAQRMPLPAAAKPSFDCANARSRGETMVCADPGLAELDRAMAAEFQRAMSAASPQQANALRQSRSRFLGYRDTCGDAVCVRQTYLGRIREIRDIMASRF